jgi:peptide/nickel transport system substrate-binding protein
MNRFRKLKIVAMAMLALLLVLTACSGGKSSNSGSSSGGSSAGTSETSGGNAQSGGDAQSGGGKSGESVLRVALPLNPRIIGYPAEVTNNGPLPFLDPVVQSLLHFDEKGNHVPWLAESWEGDDHVQAQARHQVP